VGAVDNWIWNTEPDCIQHGVGPGLPFSAEIMKPFEECTGFFTFGAGKVYAGATGHPAENLSDVGNVLTSPSAGLLTITVLGIIVMVAAFVAWVWFEHRKLTERAEKLRAAGGPRAGGTG
jgi:hypothetical protein